jgi:hypothetical protein
MLSFLTALSTPAQACAGFFHDPSVIAESSYQEVILRQGSDYIQVDYEVEIEASAAEFGWVIPIPDTFKSFEDGDSAEFATLFEKTSPIWDLEEPKKGCGLLTDNALKGGSDSAGRSNGVTIIYEGSTPTYDYTVLEAASADALNGWLSTNGWPMGESAAAIDEYVAEGGFQFIAIKLGLEVVDETVLATLPPIRIKYEGDKLVFPSRMARYSEAEQLQTIIYVEGDQRAHIEGSGWKEEELSLLWDDGENPDYMQYEAYPEAIASIGYNGGFAVTFAGELDGAWVTRFETRAPREVHTVDVAFALNGGTDAPLSLTVSNKGGCDAPEGAEALLLMPLLAAFYRRKQQR